MTRVIISIMDNNSYNHNRSYTDISIAPSLVGSNPTQDDALCDAQICS